VLRCWFFGVDTDPVCKEVVGALLTEDSLEKRFAVGSTLLVEMVDGEGEEDEEAELVVLGSVIKKLPSKARRRTSEPGRVSPGGKKKKGAAAAKEDEEEAWESGDE
jgi:hypothetical protein